MRITKKENRTIKLTIIPKITPIVSKFVGSPDPWQVIPSFWHSSGITSCSISRPSDSGIEIKIMEIKNNKNIDLIFFILYFSYLCIYYITMMIFPQNGYGSFYELLQDKQIK